MTHYRSKPNDEGSLADDRVMSLAVDREGIVWVGTIDSGLDRFDPRSGAFTHFKHDPANPNSLSRNAVTRIFEDQQGVLWVGTYKGGLNRMQRRSGEFIRYQHDSSNPMSLSNDRVLAITEGEDGVLWIGTDGGGLNRFDPEKGTFSHYRHDEADPASLSSDNVWVVHRDRMSRLWIGTQGAGLNRWEPAARQAHMGRFKRYDTRDGLPSAVINGILEDDSGNLWISTNRGISRFSPETEVFKNYDATDGLQSLEFNHGAFFRATDGEMFFGGSNGFNSFYPQLVRENPHPPDVALTAFLKFNQPVELGESVTEVREISLTHKDSVVAFEFAGLDYTAPEKNRYRYKLEGFDEDWIDAGRLRRATYTNLSPRSYTFRVMAANNDGVWNEDGLAVGVQMIPPPWRTWWAYGIYGLMVVGLLYAYARRQAQKLEREAEYNRNLQIEVDLRTQQLAQRNKELEAFNTKLEEASLTDSLTGFWNRRFLLQQIPKEIALVDRTYEPSDADGKENRPSLLFLMFDLDGFKGLNDTYGHAAGDRVLIQVRQMLIDACRQSDTIIRWGGDEFLLVGRNADPQTAENLAERIRSVMEEKKFDVGLEQTVHLTCSIGFAFYPFDAARPSFFSWEQVIGVADRALYVAKESGRNIWAGILSTSRGRPAESFQTAQRRPRDSRERGDRRPPRFRASTAAVGAGDALGCEPVSLASALIETLPEPDVAAVKSGSRALLVNESKSRASIEEAGFDVVTSEDSKEARELFARLPFDVVLLGTGDTDSSLAQALALARDLRAGSAGAATPLVVLGKALSAEAVELAYAAGATDVWIEGAGEVVWRKRLPFVVNAARALDDLSRSGQRLERAKRLARFATWEWDLTTGRVSWSEELRYLLARPAPRGCARPRSGSGDGRRSGSREVRENHLGKRQGAPPVSIRPSRGPAGRNRARAPPGRRRRGSCRRPTRNRSGGRRRDGDQEGGAPD